MKTIGTKPENVGKFIVYMPRNYGYAKWALSNVGIIPVVSPRGQWFDTAEEAQELADAFGKGHQSEVMAGVGDEVYTLPEPVDEEGYW